MVLSNHLKGNGILENKKSLEKKNVHGMLCQCGLFDVSPQEDSLAWGGAPFLNSS